VALDLDRASDSLFGNFKKKAPDNTEGHEGLEKSEKKIQSLDRAPVESKPRKPAQAKKSKMSVERVPRISISMSDEQKAILDEIARRVIRSRSAGAEAERITASTILRILSDLIGEKMDDIDLSEVNSEAELRRRISQAFLP